MTVTRSVPSPLGELVLVGDGVRLNALHFRALHLRALRLGALRLPRPYPSLDAREDGAAFPEAVLQLGEWFAGRRRTFELCLDPAGTAFQRRVWDVLLAIPFGETLTYGEVATRAGQPGAARAVGHAVGRNPLAIIVPCHRVVAAGGRLGGYAGGLDNKRWLLDHERAVATV